MKDKTRTKEKTFEMDTIDRDLMMKQISHSFKFLDRFCDDSYTKLRNLCDLSDAIMPMIHIRSLHMYLKKKEQNGTLSMDDALALMDLNHGINPSEIGKEQIVFNNLIIAYKMMAQKVIEVCSKHLLDNSSE